ncbi:MAG: phosphoribosylanthranilate isomerase [Blastochloris sp.]|nr:phosphoribosylanthranilate isomerase [Blastochloris sp.]
MKPFIKICGMTSVGDARWACELGADAVGLIVYPKSPRYVTFERAAEIAGALPAGVLKVAVSVNLSEEDREALERVWTPDVWQLHGQESPERVGALRPRRCWKALGLPWVGPDPGLYEVEAVLLDKASPAHGGTGETFDWNWARELKSILNKPMLLSGGLNPGNVVAALDAVQPWGVDVCSGVEASHGKKDPVKLKEFIELCQKY